MIIPSIDILGGQAVQLIGGKELEIEAGDPLPIARQFRLAGEIAVIDLDAALSKGSNAEQIRRVLKIAPCRVGGGIRDLKTAKEWLDAGAQKIILGTKAVPEILRELPRERVIAALDAVSGEVVVEGWRTKTGRSILEGVRELRDFVGGFLITFVEREGRLEGTDLKLASELIEAAHGARVTIAGGVSSPEEIAELDRLGADAQVGMALYSGRMDLAEAICAPLTSDRSDGLWPTVVVNERGIALGLAYSSKESLREAVHRGRGVYHSRKRGLWIKGETSGNAQELLRVDLDCDRDALRFVVKQSGEGFCHLGSFSCWGRAEGLSLLEKTLIERKTSAPAGSYTKRLYEDAELLRSKLVEEASELASAATEDDVVWEAADVIYFLMVALARSGVPLAQVEAALDRRAFKVSRRGGEAKSS